jgi:hypothetical protein
MYGEVSDEARRGWDKHARGVPIAALLEAIGRKFDDGTLECPSEVTRLAQQVAAERRSRRKK